MNQGWRDDGAPERIRRQLASELVLCWLLGSALAVGLLLLL